MGTIFELKEKVGFITLNNPIRHNSLTVQDITKVRSVLREWKNVNLSALILTGRGKSFCSGLFIGELEKRKWDENPISALCDDIESFPAPTICALNGNVYGGAVEIALACDFRIADITILLGVPAAKIGIQYECKGISRVLSSLGSSCTKRIFLLAETIDYSSLSKTNFIDFWVEDSENVLVKAGDLANEISKNAPLAVNGMKKIIVELMQGSLDENAAAEEVKNCFDSQDHLEALLARREKRKPNFRGL